jgi:hypothetical protein
MTTTTPPTQDTPILIKTRTGKKVHLGYRTSSVTNCGHWQKVQNVQFALDLEASEVAELAAMGDMILCEHCFPNGTIPGFAAKPVHKDNPREMTFAQLVATKATENRDPGFYGQDARHQATYLLRTMSTAELFANLGRSFEPRMARIFENVMIEKGHWPKKEV